MLFFTNIQLQNELGDGVEFFEVSGESRGNHGGKAFQGRYKIKWHMKLQLNSP